MAKLVENMTLEEDSASFLARLKEDCPDILSVLSKKQFELISRSPNDPYTEGKVDREYLDDAGAHQHARIMRRECKGKLHEFLIKPNASAKSLSPQELVAFEKKKDAIEKVSV